MKIISQDPDLSKIVDQDILDTFENHPVFYGDIINAQLIRTMQELTKELKLRDIHPDAPVFFGDDYG